MKPATATSNSRTSLGPGVDGTRNHTLRSGTKGAKVMSMRRGDI